MKFTPEQAHAIRANHIKLRKEHQRKVAVAKTILKRMKGNWYGYGKY